MTQRPLSPVQPTLDPTGSAPFPGPEWEEEDDLSVEWDEDWAWDGTWEEVARNPATNDTDSPERPR
jgi:hypothetical protein